MRGTHRCRVGVRAVGQVQVFQPGEARQGCHACQAFTPPQRNAPQAGDALGQGLPGVWEEARL